MLAVLAWGAPVQAAKFVGDAKIGTVLSWIEADEKSGVLSPETAARFTQMVQAYPSMASMQQDLGSSTLRPPWYTTSWQVSLINTMISLVYFCIYGANGITEKYTKVNGSKAFLFVLGLACVYGIIVFVANFALTALLIVASNELSGQARDMNKEGLCLYLMKKGVPLEPVYEKTGFLIQWGSVALDFVLLKIKVFFNFIATWGGLLGMLLSGIEDNDLTPQQT